MVVSRRIFLRQGVFATVAGWIAAPLTGWTQGHVLPGEGSAPSHNNASGRAPNPDPYAALARLQRQSFVSAIGSAFEVRTAGGSLWLRLLAVNDLPGTPTVNPASFAVLNKQVAKTSAVETAGFVLLFSGTSPDLLSQDTYTFVHESLGEFALFIVPDQSGPGQYTAVINRFAAGGLAVAPAHPVSLATTPEVSSSAPAASISSGSASPSPRLSGTRGVQRGAMRD